MNSKFLNSSLSIAPTSGFVAFDGGGVADVVAYRAPVRAPAVVRLPAEPVMLPARPVDVDVPQGMRQSAVWEPAGAASRRLVEGVLIVAMCAYFLLGFAGLVGWL
jgi:hypothetical protein